MNKETLKKLGISSCKFVIFVFCALVSIFLAVTIGSGYVLFEPNLFIARVEATLLMIIAGISISLAYLETRS